MKNSILKEGVPVGLCSDHAGYRIKEIIKRWLDKEGIAYKDFGTHSEESCDYSDFAHLCASAIELGDCYPGIAVCGSGQGVNMTLNKHEDVRSALCWNVEVARLARQHNDANAIALPGRFINDKEAIQMIEAFLTAPFEGGRHQRRIDKIAPKK